MTTTPGLINASLVARRSFVHFFWQGAVLALALVAALKITEKNFSTVRYLLCCVTMAGMALCPVLVDRLVVRLKQQEHYNRRLLGN
jgi:hypothetical protein